MIVCLCRAKSDRDVARAIEEGTSSLTDLQRCGIGTDCGACHGSLRQMLASAAAADAAIAATPRPAPRPATVSVSA